jgi:hypothetical protein
VLADRERPTHATAVHPLQPRHHGELRLDVAGGRRFGAGAKLIGGPSLPSGLDRAPGRDLADGLRDALRLGRMG